MMIFIRGALTIDDNGDDEGGGDDDDGDDDGVGDDDGGGDDYGGDDDDGGGVNYGAEGVILHGGCIVLSLCTLGTMMGMMTIVLKTMMIKIALMMMIAIVKI